ncbi:hypothetical protein GEMRC1_002790 [Eukaryota sp. GEM-RC1]
MTIQEAISKAQQAVAADENGNYSSALPLYTTAVTLIDDCLKDWSKLSKTASSALMEHKKTYLARIEILNQFLATSSSSTDLSDFLPPSSVPMRDKEDPKYARLFDLPFIPFEIPPIDPASISPPQCRYSAPFWFLRLISSSIRRGSHITNSLFIPRSFWNSDSPNPIPYSIEQVAFFDRLSDFCLMSYRSLSRSNGESPLETLRRFLEQVSEFHSLLRNKLNDDTSGRFGGVFKKLSKTLSTVKRAVPLQVYSDSLCKVCENCLLLEDYLVKFLNDTESQEVSDVANDILNFLTNGVCRIVYSDVMVLAQSFKSNMLESFLSGV